MVGRDFEQRCIKRCLGNLHEFRFAGRGYAGFAFRRGLFNGESPARSANLSKNEARVLVSHSRQENAAFLSCIIAAVPSWKINVPAVNLRCAGFYPIIFARLDCCGRLNVAGGVAADLASLPRVEGIGRDSYIHCLVGLRRGFDRMPRQLFIGRSHQIRLTLFVQEIESFLVALHDRHGAKMRWRLLPLLRPLAGPFEICSDLESEAVSN